MLSLKIWWGSALQHAMPVQAALNLLSAIVCVCVSLAVSEDHLQVNRFLTATAPILSFIRVMMQEGMAAVSVAFPTKLWDSAGRECGHTVLHLHLYVF